MEAIPVYVSEVPSRSRTVVGVETSITAFVGGALRGPLDEAVPINSFAEFHREFGGLSHESGLSYTVRDFYRNGGGPALVVRVAKDATAAEVSLDELILTAHSPGAWANGLMARVTHPKSSEQEESATAQRLPHGKGLFTLELTLGDEIESFVNVSASDGPRRVDHVLESTSRLVRVRGAVPTDRPAETTDTLAVMADGSDGILPDAQSYFPRAGGNVGARALLTADLFNILVLSPPTLSGQLPDAVWADALAFAHKHRAFLLVDPPASASPDAVAQWASVSAGLSGPGTRNAAVYFPGVLGDDPLHDGTVTAFASSGAMAGVYARTDAARGVWKAPAGGDAKLMGAQGLSQKLTDTENSQLIQQGINVIRSFPGSPAVAWGARTLRAAEQPSHEYKYIQVRRVSLFIEESLQRGTQWVVTQANDEALWTYIRLSVGAFLEDLYRKGAFQGANQRDAYFVRCNSETTTASDIECGIVNIQVGFAPLKPAEFVVITIQQQTATSRR